MPSYGVTLLSGGLDSTTVSAYARQHVDRLTALTFLYGQTHSKETRCATDVANHLRLNHVLIDISFLRDVSWYSALTNPEMFPTPKDRSTREMGASIPITYVPLRNTLFLTLAGAYLESEALKAIEMDNRDPADVEAHIYIAPNAIDYSGYPDCRPQFYAEAQRTLLEGSKLWNQYGVVMEIHTPIIHMTKKDIIQWAQELQAPLHLTWSCYEGAETPCTRCDSCQLRAKGFHEAGVADPLLERPPNPQA